MNPLALLLRGTAGALAASAVALRSTAMLAELAARTLSPRPLPTSRPSPPPERGAVPGLAGPAPEAPPASAQPPLLSGTEDTLGVEDGHVRRPESSAADLAAQPSAAVLQAIGGLSTDELSALFDYEQTHRRRKTVLTAIEAALTPPGADLIVTPDVDESKRG